jgi:hypothetical protein
MLGACELIILSRSAPLQREQPAALDQRSAHGVVRLFVAELVNDNVYGAMRLYAGEERPLLAVEKLDLLEDVLRAKRIIGTRKITSLVSDTLSASKQRIRTEFDYTKELTFTTVKIDDEWFISAMTDIDPPH